MACTTFASTNTTDLSYFLETDCGTTPDDAAFQLLPTTGGGPTGNITTAVSEVIRSDRMTDDLILVDSEISGSINYELSYAPYKPIIEALLRDDDPKTIDLDAQTWAYVASTGEVTVADTTAFAVGQFVRTDSATEAATGVFKIVSITDATTMNIGVDASVDFSVTDLDIWGYIYRNGSAVAKNYTILKRVLNNGSYSYFYNRGCQISQMSFNFETGSILKGAFDVVGLTEDATDTEYSGGVGDGGTPTYVQPPSYTIMNSVSSISEIDLGGLSSSTEFSNLGLTINNNLNPAKAIGTLGAAAIAPFTLDIKADTTVFFEDTVIYNKYITSDSFYIDIRLVDGTGNTLVLSMPKVKFSDLAVPIDGKDSFLMQSGSVTALRDQTNNYMVQIAYLDATKPV